MMVRKDQFKTECLNPKSLNPKSLNPKGHVPKGLDSKERVPKSITLSVALALLSSFAAQGSSEQSTVDPLSEVDSLSKGEPLPKIDPPSKVDHLTSQVLKTAENKRLVASICADSMNRIAVANDRITQIFGDEGTFESQNDENTGQVFLKPTAENGSKSLSLTIITEQGITQDLTLKPTAKSATTLILSRDSRTRVSSDQNSLESTQRNQRSSPWGANSDSPQHSLAVEQTSPAFAGAGRPSIPVQEQLLTILRQAITGQLPVMESGATVDPQSISRPNPLLDGCSVTYDQSWHAEALMSAPYVVHAFRVENLTETPLELQEKDFYQPGDLALSLQRSTVDPRRILPAETRLQQGETMLYVVRYADNVGTRVGETDLS